MKTYKAYKVLYQKIDGSLVSCCRNSDFPKEFVVEYKVGKSVKPNIPESKLFAFLDLQEAISFALTMCSNRMVIYECECTGLSTSARPQTFRFCENTRQNFIRYWKNFAQAKNAKRAIPKGSPIRFPYESSVTFDSIKLTNLVECNH